MLQIPWPPHGNAHHIVDHEAGWEALASMQNLNLKRDHHSSMDNMNYAIQAGVLNRFAGYNVLGMHFQEHCQNQLSVSGNFPVQMHWLSLPTKKK